MVTWYTCKAPVSCPYFLGRESNTLRRAYRDLGTRVKECLFCPDSMCIPMGISQGVREDELTIELYQGINRVRWIRVDLSDYLQRAATAPN